MTIQIIVENPKRTLHALETCLQRIDRKHDQVLVYNIEQLITAILDQLGPSTCENGHHNKYDPCTNFHCQKCGGEICQETPWVEGLYGNQEHVCADCRSRFYPEHHETPWCLNLHLVRQGLEPDNCSKCSIDITPFHTDIKHCKALYGL